MTIGFNWVEEVVSADFISLCHVLAYQITGIEVNLLERRICFVLGVQLHEALHVSTEHGLIQIRSSERIEHEHLTVCWRQTCGLLGQQYVGRESKVNITDLLFRSSTWVLQHQHKLCLWIKRIGVQCAGAITTSRSVGLHSLSHSVRVTVLASVDNSTTAHGITFRAN